MKSSRTQILSFSEVEEAVRTFVRQKYHEKIDKDDTLCSVVVNDDESGDKSISFTFTELVMPYVKHKSKV